MPGKHGFETRTGHQQPPGRCTPEGKFGRLFPDLAPLTLTPSQLSAYDELALVMKDNTPPLPAGDNLTVPAGYTYFGQFIDHDMTFDPTALQETIVDPLALSNFRTPMLDLDCLYGTGPNTQPFLYDRASNGEKFLIGSTSTTPGGGDASVPTSLPHDLSRSTDGFALLGDPRNDENLIVAQLHLAFLRFHNAIIDGFANGSLTQESPLRKTRFEEAREWVIWHYQWIVLHDFLHRVLDQAILQDVLDNGPSFYKPQDNGAFIPVEFSGAAYRFGHTMVRDTYEYNRVFNTSGIPATLKLLFFFTGASGPGAGVPIPSDWIIDWRRFFEIDPALPPSHSRRFDPLLAPTLAALPGVPPPNSLAARNLRRGNQLGLPTGQSVARRLGLTPLTPTQISTGPDGAVALDKGFHIETPLWYYILKEAEVQGLGQKLGEVGSRLVAEVIVGIILADSSSYLRRRPDWTPRLPSTVAGTFTLPDLLLFAAGPGGLAPGSPSNPVG